MIVFYLFVDCFEFDSNSFLFFFVVDFRVEYLVVLGFNSVDFYVCLMDLFFEGFVI